MRAAVFLLVVGLFALVMQTAPSSSKIWFDFKPDFILILVVWAGLRLPAVSGLSFAFVAGLTVGLLSGALPGLFALIYCLLVVACGNLNARVDIDNFLGRAWTIFGATLASAAAVLLARWTEGPVDFGKHALGWILMKSCVTALVSLAVFPLVEWLWAGYSRLVGER